MNTISTNLKFVEGTGARAGDRGRSASEGTFEAVLNKSLEEKAGPEREENVKMTEYTVKPGDTLWKIGLQRFGADPYQIARDNGIANPDRIYPGQKLLIRKTSPSGPQTVVASWYGKDYHNKPTASGEKFDMFQDTLAHKTLPLGTMVRLVNPENGLTAVAKINDRGPFIRGRDIDLSYGLAERLGMVQKGVGPLIMEVL
jgi:rare lipoprotein A